MKPEGGAPFFIARFDPTMQIARRFFGMHGLVSALLIIPALLPLILFILVPAIQSVSMSVQEVSFGIPAKYVGLKNYTKMIENEVFHIAFWHTIMFSFANVAGEIFFGFMVAVLMSTRFRMEKLFIALIMVPYAVSEVVAIIIWKYMLEPDVGIVNYVLYAFLGLPQIEWITYPIQTWTVIILLRVWLRFPFAFLIIYASMVGIPTELFESAYIDGANNGQGLIHITIPLVTPAIMVATIFGFVFAFRNFATVWILTTGGPIHRTELLSTLLYKEAFQFWHFGAASAIAIVMTILTFLIAAYYLRSMYKQMFLKNV
jgi:multiple sugar transport system permease protein